MNKENVFNKEKFAFLLNKAKGDRSINKYAEETTVSAAHISRFLREMIESAPTPDTISKLASKADNDVSYKNLMEAAGYIALEEGSRIRDKSPQEKMEKAIKAEQDMMNIIINYLMEQDFKWTMEKPAKNFRFHDLMVKLEDENYDKWYFEFKFFSHSSIFQVVHHLYGRLSTIELDPKDKFTLVINNEDTLKSIIRRPAINLRLNFYVMVLDTENRKVVREVKITDYYDGLCLE